MNIRGNASKSISIALICLLSVESFSQTKFSLNPADWFKTEDSSSSAEEANSAEKPKAKKNSSKNCTEEILNKCNNYNNSNVSVCSGLYGLLGNYEYQKNKKEYKNNLDKSFEECSYSVEKCECWANTKQKEASGQHWEHPYDSEQRVKSFQYWKDWFLQEGKNSFAQIQKQEETKKREQAKQDSIEREFADAKQKSTDEIYALIENGGEVSLILDKCTQHRKTYRFLQKCSDIEDSVQYQQRISEITALLKSNNSEKLKECIDKCETLNYTLSKVKAADPSMVANLCEKQLTSKIKKLPKKSIISSELAKRYFDNHEQIVAWIIQNDGKMVLAENISLGTIMMIQYTGHLGECMLRPTRQIPFMGNVKYLGEKTYTTVMGVRQSVPNYQLLWCDSFP